MSTCVTTITVETHTGQSSPVLCFTGTRSRSVPPHPHPPPPFLGRVCLWRMRLESCDCEGRLLAAGWMSLSTSSVSGGVGGGETETTTVRGLLCRWE